MKNIFGFKLCMLYTFIFTGCYNCYHIYREHIYENINEMQVNRKIH